MNDAATVKGMRSRVSDALIDALANDADATVREQAALALGSFASCDRVALEALLAHVAAQDIRLRTAAIAALGDAAREQPEARVALIEALEDDSRDVRRAALLALGASRCQEESAPAAVLDMLVREPSLWEEAATALVSLGPRRLIDRLSDLMLHSEAPEVRRGAARALRGLERRRQREADGWPLHSYDAGDGSWRPLY